MWLRKTSLLAMAMILLGLSCSGAESSGPVPIYPEDRCVACGMHILDTRYAAEAILANGEVWKFDDMGEMFMHLKAKKVPMEKVRALYVQDFQSRQWMRAEDASYVVSEDIHTPMGTGVIAFSNHSEAAKTAERLHGRIATFQDMMSGD